LHTPHELGDTSATAWPTSKPVTSGPIAAIRPPISWPSVNGIRHPIISPTEAGICIIVRSLWQRPFPATSTST